MLFKWKILLKFWQSKAQHFLTIRSRFFLLMAVVVVCTLFVHFVLIRDMSNIKERDKLPHMTSRIALSKPTTTTKVAAKTKKDTSKESYHKENKRKSFRHIPKRKEISFKSKRMMAAEDLSLREPSHVTKQRFDARVQTIAGRCSRIDPEFRIKWQQVKEKGAPTDGYIGSYRHRTMLCQVLKAGSSTWNDVFWNLRAPGEAAREQFWEKAIHGNVNAFEELEAAKKLEIWKDQASAIMVNVRHPFARMISGWRDKCQQVYYYNTWFKQYPELKKYTNMYGRWQGPGQYFIEWKDFARFIADHGDNSSCLDPHFKPIATTCDPCVVPFNFVIKLETFEEDAAWILKNILKTSARVLRLHNSSSWKRESPKDTIKKYFSQLPTNLIKRLYDVYEQDFLLFDYTFDLNNLTAGGW
ncbi:carbohydrate sulfotransferase 10-like [Clavelina lepadiformis]|uniref:carbohydrate sulfotransferase 10-like n=1 Tax=Clavelina lepadiformis TaxID=159417 RepID=UPI0040427822